MSQNTLWLLVYQTPPAGGLGAWDTHTIEVAATSLDAAQAQIRALHPRVEFATHADRGPVESLFGSAA